MELAILVPARLASTRFPKKLLHPIRGKPLILWVAERLAAEARGIPVWFAVDAPELRKVLEAAGQRVVMTDPAHASGTDRLAEANRVVGARKVINVQGDEPLVTGEQVRQLAALLEVGFPMGTLATRFRRPEDFLNPNQVKVVWAHEVGALFFTRSPVPHPRDLGGPGAVTEAWLERHPCHRHLGLYAYDAEFLEAFASWPPGRLEQVERLEQLRVLERGHRIGVAETPTPTIGVDTVEDVEAFERLVDGGTGTAAVR